MQDSEKLLEAELQIYFKGDKRRRYFIVKLLIGVLKMCTVSYSKLSKVVNPKRKKESNYKRIQRFFKIFRFSMKLYSQYVFHFIAGESGQIVLSIDRTNWKFGEQNINILMIGICYNGIAIPLIWKMLNKRGNSSQSERMLLIRGLKLFLRPEQWKQIRCLVGDREFIGKKWIKFLKKQKVHFVFRIKKNSLISHKGKDKNAYKLFECNHLRVLIKPRLVYGISLYVSGQRLEISGKKLDYFILISDLSGAKAQTLYKERWAIEVLFGVFKTRGFNFEDTHVKNLKRINTMIFILAIASIWAIKTGEWLIENGFQIPIKIVDGKAKKLYSIFRIGLDELNTIFLNHLPFSNLIRLLSCT